MNSNQQLTKLILDLSFSAWENDLSLNEQQQYHYHKLLALCIKVLKLNDGLTGTTKTKVEKFCNAYAKLCGQGLDFDFNLEGLSKTDKAALTNKVMLILPQICEFTARESENYFTQVKYLADAKPFSLQGFRIENAKLIGLNLSLCNLQNSHLKDCQLKNCDLTAADMTLCYIDHCEIIESIFTRAKLLKAKVNNSKLQGSRFNAVDMRDCRISQSDVNQSDFKDAQTALVFILTEVDRTIYEDLKFNVESLTESFAEQNEPLHRQYYRLVQPLVMYLTKRCQENFAQADKKRRCKMLFALSCMWMVAEAFDTCSKIQLLNSSQKGVLTKVQQWLEEVAKEKDHKPLFQAIKQNKSNFSKHFRAFMANLQLANQKNIFFNLQADLEFIEYKTPEPNAKLLSSVLPEKRFKPESLVGESAEAVTTRNRSGSDKLPSKSTQATPGIDMSELTQALTRRSNSVTSRPGLFSSASTTTAGSSSEASTTTSRQENRRVSIKNGVLSNSQQKFSLPSPQM